MQSKQKKIRRSLLAMFILLAAVVVMTFSEKSHAANQVTYTVHFHANGGSVSSSAKNVKYGQKLGTLPIPTKSGFSFAGWSKTQTGSPNYVNANTTFSQTSDLWVYARWIKNVSFDSNGGSAVPNRKYLMGTTYGTLPSVSKSGYRFLGWYRGRDRSERVYDTNNVLVLGTLYAKWEKVTGKFKAKGCHNADGSFHSKEEHKTKYKANNKVVQGLRNAILYKTDSKQKNAVLYALDAVGSYYCQEQRNTDGAYDCSSLVSRAYVYAGVTSTFKDLPGSRTIQSRLAELVRKGKAEKVTNGKYQPGDIMLHGNDYHHVSIYVGTYGGVKYRVAAEGHKDGVAYFDVTKRSDYSAVYRLK